MSVWARIKFVAQGVLFTAVAVWIGVATPLAVTYILEH
jgi:hypothetical protein